MADAMDVHGNVFKNGAAVLLARVVGDDGSAVVQADISSAAYSVYLLDDAQPDQRTAVSGHTDIALVVADVIFDAMQTDSIWTVDVTGFNFRLLLDVSANQAFATAARRYLVEVRLSPASGQVIVVRFRCNAI